MPIDPRSILDPQSITDQQDIDFKRQMAQALIQRSLTPTQGHMAGNVYVAPNWTQGLASMLGVLQGKQMQGEAGQQTQAMNARYAAMLKDAMGMNAPAVPQGPSQDFQAGTQALGSGAQQGNQPGQMTDGQWTPPQQNTGPTIQNAALAGQLRSQMPDQSQQPQDPTNPFNIDPKLRFQAAIGFPGADEMLKGVIADRQMTPEAKNAGAAFGAGSPEARAALVKQVQKAGYIAPVSGRPGGWMVYPDGHREWNPHVPENSMPITGPNGQFTGVQPIPGAMNVAQQSANAVALGKAQATPTQVWNPQTGQMEFTSAAAVLPNAPQGTPPQGAPGARMGPQMAPTLDSLQEQRRLVASNGGQPITPESQVAINRQLQAIDGEIAKFQGGGRPAAAPPLGLENFASGQATDASKRATATRAAAADSQTRVNVLDNIISLADSAGPGAETMNKWMGLVSNLPGAKNIMSGTQDKVAQFQELKKFVAQNGARAWQAAGGTGTDAQLSAAMNSQPNDTMFPQALRTIGAWAKAGELAQQGKANSQDAWLSKNGNNPAAQTAFENQWRNSFDPMLYNLRTMSPTEAAKLVDNMKHTQPAKYQELMQKAQSLKALGGL